MKISFFFGLRSNNKNFYNIIRFVDQKQSELKKLSFDHSFLRKWQKTRKNKMPQYSPPGGAFRAAKDFSYSFLICFKIAEVVCRYLVFFSRSGYPSNFRQIGQNQAENGHMVPIFKKGHLWHAKKLFPKDLFFKVNIGHLMGTWQILAFLGKKKSFSIWAKINFLENFFQIMLCTNLLFWNFLGTNF